MKMTKWQAYFPEDMLTAIDAWAVKHGVASRSDAVRTLLRKALDSEQSGRRLSKTERGEMDKLLGATGADTFEDALRLARRVVTSAHTEG
jgi:metal-responsive CopG/Arc/MetJ family transcriptional regulator